MLRLIRDFFARRRAKQPSLKAYEAPWVDTMPTQPAELGGRIGSNPPPRYVKPPAPPAPPPARKNFAPPRPLPASRRAVIDGDDLPDSDPFMPIHLFTRSLPPIEAQEQVSAPPALKSGGGGDYAGAGASGGWESRECTRDDDARSSSDSQDSSCSSSSNE